MDAQLKALPILPVRARTVSGCVNSANLNISQHFTVHLFRPWIPSPACGKGGGPRRFTAIVLNVSRRRFGGPAGVEPQSPGEPGPRRGGPLIAIDRESFEKQPVRAGAEACECTLSNQRSGTGIGDAVRNHVVIPAAVFAQSEPDRTTVEVRQTSRSLRSLPADLRSVSSCHPRGSRRSFNHSRRKAEVADDAQVPAIRRCFTHGRVRYMIAGAGLARRDVAAMQRVTD